MGVQTNEIPLIIEGVGGAADGSQYISFDDGLNRAPAVVRDAAMQTITGTPFNVEAFKKRGTSKRTRSTLKDVKKYLRDNEAI